MKPLALMLAIIAAPAHADLLATDQNWREIPFDVVDEKPMIAVSVNGMPGRMMFDNGTPEAVFFNRDAAPIGEGEFKAEGRAASGQVVRAHLHDAPMIEIAGRPVTIPPKVMSGDFDFVEGMFGADYMGFIGTPMVASQAFVLDYDRKVLTVLRVDAAGALIEPSPPPEDIVAEVAFSIWPGEHPTTAISLGGLPMLMDVDTGDSGTLYLRPSTRAGLIAKGAIREDGDMLIIDEIVFGGASFRNLVVREVQTGGPDDTRASHASDWLRIGASFLSGHPSLWNFPAGTLTLLAPDAQFLAAR